MTAVCPCSAGVARVSAFFAGSRRGNVLAAKPAELVNDCESTLGNYARPSIRAGKAARTSFGRKGCGMERTDHGVKIGRFTLFHFFFLDPLNC